MKLILFKYFNVLIYMPITEAISNKNATNDITKQIETRKKRQTKTKLINHKLLVEKCNKKSFNLFDQ